MLNTRIEKNRYKHYSQLSTEKQSEFSFNKIFSLFSQKKYPISKLFKLNKQDVKLIRDLLNNPNTLQFRLYGISTYEAAIAALLEETILLNKRKDLKRKIHESFINLSYRLNIQASYTHLFNIYETEYKFTNQLPYEEMSYEILIQNTKNLAKIRQKGDLPTYQCYEAPEKKLKLAFMKLLNDQTTGSILNYFDKKSCSLIDSIEKAIYEYETDNSLEHIDLKKIKTELKLS